MARARGGHLAVMRRSRNTLGSNRRNVWSIFNGPAFNPILIESILFIVCTIIRSIVNAPIILVVIIFLFCRVTEFVKYIRARILYYTVNVLLASMNRNSWHAYEPLYELKVTLGSTRSTWHFQISIGGFPAYICSYAPPTDIIEWRKSKGDFWP